METSVRLKVSELDTDLLKAIKRLFGKNVEVTLTVRSTDEHEAPRAESKKSYLARLEKAIKNLEKGATVKFSEAELDNFVLDRLKG